MRMPNPKHLQPRYFCTRCGVACEDHEHVDHEFETDRQILATVFQWVKFDANKQKYRVVIKGKHICYTETLTEALRRRDDVLKERL